MGEATTVQQWPRYSATAILLCSTNPVTPEEEDPCYNPFLYLPVWFQALQSALVPILQLQGQFFLPDRFSLCLCSLRLEEYLINDEVYLQVG